MGIAGSAMQKHQINLIDAKAPQMGLEDLGYKMASLEITNICNFRCQWCPYTLGRTLARSMKKEEAFYAIDQLKKCGGDQLNYLELNLLGEPLIHPHLFDIIEYAHRQNIKVKIVTNGSLFSAEMIDKLLESRPEIIKISLQALSAEGFNSVRGTPISFNEYVRRIANLIKRRADYGETIPTLIQLSVFHIRGYYRKVLFGMMPHDDYLKYVCHNKRTLLKGLIAFLDILHKEYGGFGYDKKELSHNYEKIKNEDFSNDIPVCNILKKVDITLKQHSPWLHLTDKYPLRGKDGVCKSDKMGILADGRVVLCCLDCFGGTTIGNIFTDDLGNILLKARDKIAMLRKGEFVFDLCKQCHGYFTKRHRFLKWITGKFNVLIEYEER